MIAFQETSNFSSEALNSSVNERTPVRHKVFTYTTNDRMAGGVPVWKEELTAKEGVVGKLASAKNAGNPDFSDNSLGYSEYGVTGNSQEEMTFSDIVDMVNPLQHIPLVSNVYREITGDEIKPISRIIGGGVFGGAAGAASNLVEVIIMEETGKDITGNVVSIVAGDSSDSERSEQTPSEKLDIASRMVESGKTDPDLSANAFVQGNIVNNSGYNSYKKLPAAHGRTAGSVYSYI